ncbi:hypothetical protein ABZ896_37800 [Streptomyces sp. NPDC047072]|uniref:hypothetical protein n=1 Tax=Streptomyces sp. NPDC047072 TaxID=3154809 RepID=UPI0033D1AEF3
MAFDEKKFKRARENAFSRLEQYRGLRKGENSSLHKAANDFFKHLLKEGRQINAGKTPTANKDVVKELISELDKKKAFSVRGDWWLKNQDERFWSSHWDDDRNAAARKQVKKSGIWSKSTGMPAEVRALFNDGRTLEYSPGAAFMDDLERFNDLNTPLPTLNYMWGEASHTYTGHSRGMVDADVYRGIDENSVLKNIEMPILLDLMEAGQVDGVTIHVRRRNQQTGILDETATYTIRSRESWDQVMMLDRTPSYIAEQGREYQTQQVARAIIRNQNGMQTSLEDFRRILEHANADPDSAVFITGQDGPFPIEGLQVTAQQMAGWQRHPSQDSSAGANWPARPSAEQTLVAKLEAHSAVQGNPSYDSSDSETRTRLGRAQPTGSPAGSADGAYLAPVNTVASGGAYMVPSEEQYLPTQPLTATGAPVYSYQDQAQNELFTTPTYGGPSRAPATSYQPVDSPAPLDSGESYFAPQPAPYSTGQGHYSAYTMSPNMRYTNPTYTMSPNAAYTMNPHAQYTMSPNATGSSGQPVASSGSSTSSSSGFGEPLARTNARTTPPPAPRRSM